MSPKKARVLLFEDATVDPVPALRELSQDAKRSVALNQYLRLCASALQTELTLSTSPSRKLYPRFSNIIELAEWLSRSPTPQIVVQAVLLCVAQVGALLREYETTPALLQSSGSQPIYAVGLCNGMIGAAALAACKSIADLLDVGPRLVCVNLRLLLALSDRSTAIEETTETWTVITPHLSAAEHEPMIADFLAIETSIPATRVPYVSAEANKVSTISGPPSTLAKYFSSCEKLRAATKLEVPINTACHAPHLQFDDFDLILGNDPLWKSCLVDEHVNFISIHTGSLIDAPDVATLLLYSIDEVLNKRFRWGAVLRELGHHLKSSCDSVDIYAIGPDRVSATVKYKLTECGLDVTVIDQPLQTTARISADHDDVAIVGMSGRLPGGANSLDEIWQLLEQGRDTHGDIPSDRFDLGNHFDASGQVPNTTNVPYGCFIDRPGFFDAKLFNMSPREAKQTDPMQRLALLTTYEALEMAGYSPNARPSFFSDRIGTFFGQTLDDYRETNACQDVDIYYIPGGVRAFGPGRMNYHFKWEGPSMSVDTACSSSALAVQLAFQSLRLGECDLAVAGGMNIITSSDMYAGLAKGGFLSKTGQCKTFSETADGYCRGEGVGTIVMKRLRDAVDDHDNILAVIKSASTNHSAFAKSITYPDSGAQIKVMRQILRDASMSPNQIDYVEMHGTGTPAGDPIELASVAEVFGQGRDERNSLCVGSIKANVGHGEAAAGINSLIKVLLMLRNSTIPANVGVQNQVSTQFRKVDLAKVSIDTQSKAFNTQGSSPRRVVLNSFNAAGGNTAMIVEDAPKFHRNTTDPRSHHVIAISGHTRHSFLENRRRLLGHLQKCEINIADVAYTTTARRMQHSIRDAVVVTDQAHAVKLLSYDIENDVVPVRIPEKHRVIFSFTGQGSHYLDMARLLVSTSPVFQNRLKLYASLCQNQGLPSFMDIIHGQSGETASQAELHLSIIAVQLALVETLEAWGIRPDAVIGHSIGEYAALATAGVISVADALFLVGKRGQLVDSTCTAGEHTMLAVTADKTELQHVLSSMEPHQCVMACYNGPSSLVISGPQAELSQLADHLTKRQISHTSVAVAYGYHSPQMRSVSKKMAQICNKAHFSAPRITVASTLLGKVVKTTGIFNADYLVQQTLCPVLYSDALRELSIDIGQREPTTWFEIGTHPVCGTMIMSSLGINSERVLYVLRRNEKPWYSLSKALAGAFKAGIEVDWPCFHEDHHHALKVIDLPTYSFDLEDFWIPYSNDWKLKKSHKNTVDPSRPNPILDINLAPFHYLKSEIISENKAEILLGCDLTEKSLFSMVQGHLVDGVGLCPSSVYAHLAYNAAHYIVPKIFPDRRDSPTMELATMMILSPLTVSSDSQSAHLSVKVEWASTQSQAVTVVFETSTSSSEKVQHCQCTVNIGDPTLWRRDWAENEYLIQGRAKLLTDHSHDSVQSLHRELMYHLFSSAIVKYSSDYQVCNRIRIDYSENECLAELHIPDNMINKNGSPGPFCLDALMHTAGFVLNSSPRFDHDTVFIASGWTSLRLAEPLRAGQAYHCYSRMAAGQEMGLFLGNVSILSGNHIIGLCKGLRFHRLKRMSLHKLLGIHKNKGGLESRTVITTSSQNDPGHSYRKKSQLADQVEATSIDVSLQKIMEDIAEETGTSVSNLNDDTDLQSLGIDSLMSIALLQRFEKRTGSTLPTKMFTVCATIGELKQYVATKVKDDDTSKSKFAKSSATNLLSTFCEKSVPSRSDNTISTKASRSEILCEVIAMEVGIGVDEVKVASQFNELGIDSLLMVSIINGYRTRTGEELGARFFNDNPTLENALHKLDGKPSSSQEYDSDSTVLSTTSHGNSYATTPTTSELESGATTPPSMAPVSLHVVSMLIQGRADGADTAVFFLPDGSGSLFSYIHLPDLRPDLPVYAFDSPFHRNPEDFNVSFEAVAQAYVQRIQQIQPHGPYIVAGWSLGGVHAYEVTRQLLASGEEVEHLIMLDSPCPGTLPPLPNASLDLLEKAGVFEALSKEAKGVANHTRQHFVKVTHAFQNWKDRPLYDSERERLGKASIIWAKHGVLEDDEQARNAWVPGMDKTDTDMLKAKEWLTGKRTDFTDGGWGKLVGKDVNIYTVPANHFSMMFPPKVSETAERLREIL